MKAPRLYGEARARAAARLVSNAAALKGLACGAASEDDAILGGSLEDHAAPILLIDLDAAAGPIAGLDLLEALHPAPTLFPNGNRAMPLALTDWALKAAHGPAPAAAALIARQLTDGRPFLQGDAPGLADLQSDTALSRTPDAELTETLQAWRARLHRTLVARVEAGPRVGAPTPPKGTDKDGDALIVIKTMTGPDGRTLRLRVSAYDPDAGR